MLKLHIKHIFFGLLTVAPLILFAQTEGVIEEENYVFDCYQTHFMDEDLERIQKVEIEGKKIQFEYIPDTKQLILHDYKGKGRIKCFGTSPSGEKVEYSKSPCYIDPCENAI